MYYVILALMTFIGAIASLFLKKASKSGGIFQIIRSLDLYIGGGLYILSAILNIYILHHLDYSVVLPLTAITYIWTMFLSKCFLKENISTKKLGGIFLILVGAILVAK